MLTDGTPRTRTPALDRVFDRLSWGALAACGIVLLGAAVHRWVVRLPDGLRALERPVLVGLLAVFAVVEAYRFARWGVHEAALFRWTRPVAGFLGLAAAIVLRLVPEERAAAVVMPAFGVACGILAMTLLADLRRAHRRGTIDRAVGARLGAGTLGLALLAVLTGAGEVLPNRLWLVGFVVMLPLLAVGALAAARLRRTPATARAPGA